MTDYTELVKALRCKGLSKKCDSCGYGYHISPDSECNDACHFEQIAEDAAAAIEELQARVEKQDAEITELLAEQAKRFYSAMDDNGRIITNPCACMNIPVFPGRSESPNS